ncbi:unnamed protein product [Rotaria sp. Silwood1]|nr:unnamed protein product [Rotaria sp. Silwood1]
MSIIDRYTCTCKLASPMRRLAKLKMIPWLIGIIIILSFLASLRGLILFEYKRVAGCVATYPLINNILYFVVQVLMQPVIMLVFVLLTFRNVRQSRQRVPQKAVDNCDIVLKEDKTNLRTLYDKVFRYKITIT